MKRVNMQTWIVTGLAIAAAGCSTPAPTVNSTADAQQPAAQLAPERAVLMDGQATNDEVLKALPRRISEADAQKMLVNLPADKLQGPLAQGNERSTQQRWGRGWRGRGFGWGGRGFGFGGLGWGGFSYYPYNNFYYPYYLSAGYYYPYSYPYYGSYYYPYYYGYGNYYRPYAWRYGARWW
ncbi:MAG TPA: hypothetical protein V6D00_10205 [Pantanalinema sp.]